MKQIKPVIFLTSIIIAISMVTGPGPPDNPGNGGGPPECPGNSCENGNKDKEAPNIQINQSETNLSRGSTNNLTVNIEDNHNISTVYLLTNETGSMERKKVYSSPKTVYKKSDNLSFQWNNFSIKNRSVNWKVFANDTNGNARNSSSKIFKVFSKPELKVDNFEVKNQSPIKEGDEVKIEGNISNTGTATAEFNIALGVETDEGNGYVQKNQIMKNVDLDINKSKTVSFSWNAKPGPYRFTLDTASANYSLDSNNSLNVDVSSHQIYYGNSNVEVRLSSGEDMFFRLESENSKGRIYFSDYNSNYLFSDLKPLNNLSEIKLADKSLELEGHNDSLEKLFDKNEDDELDNFKEMEVGQRSLTVPVIDSTPSGGFKTGILYNSGKKGFYDGSQDLVFVTPLRNNFEGAYGVYDYETKIPSGLKSQTGHSNKISIYTELE